MTAFWCDNPRDVLRISGSDALAYLESQISQDIRNLGDGEATHSFVLQPAGKIEALVRIVRRSSDEFFVDTDQGSGESLRNRLNRFKIRVKVDIEAVDWSCIAVRGSQTDVGGGVPAWGRSDAFDLFGGDPQPPAGIRAGSLEELTLSRIEAGWPAMGSEITEASIPGETGVVSLAVSFTKGCYPGQELVERMDSRGSSAPRFVRRLRGVGNTTVGDRVLHHGNDVGAVTSVACTGTGWVALAKVARAAQPGDAVIVGSAESALEDVSVREN